jgi:hypothetical protein
MRIHHRIVFALVLAAAVGVRAAVPLNTPTNLTLESAGVGASAEFGNSAGLWDYVVSITADAAATYTVTALAADTTAACGFPAATFTVNQTSGPEQTFLLTVTMHQPWPYITYSRELIHRSPTTGACTAVQKLCTDAGASTATCTRTVTTESISVRSYFTLGTFSVLNTDSDDLQCRPDEGGCQCTIALKGGSAMPSSTFGSYVAGGLALYATGFVLLFVTLLVNGCEWEKRSFGMELESSDGDGHTTRVAPMYMHWGGRVLIGGSAMLIVLAQVLVAVANGVYVPDEEVGAHVPYRCTEPQRYLSAAMKASLVLSGIAALTLLLGWRMALYERVSDTAGGSVRLQVSRMGLLVFVLFFTLSLAAMLPFVVRHPVLAAIWSLLGWSLVFALVVWIFSFPAYVLTVLCLCCVKVESRRRHRRESGLHWTGLLLLLFIGLASHVVAFAGACVGTCLKYRVNTCPS